MKEQIELAAKALGITDLHYMQHVGAYTLDLDGIVCWNPALSQADSDKMACDLEINLDFGPDLDFGANCVVAVWSKNLSFWQQVQHDNTTEGRRAAVRQARLLVAAEIGRGMK